MYAYGWCVEVVNDFHAHFTSASSVVKRVYNITDDVLIRSIQRKTAFWARYKRVCKYCAEHYQVIKEWYKNGATNYSTFDECLGEILKKIAEKPMYDVPDCRQPSLVAVDCMSNQKRGSAPQM